LFGGAAGGGKSEVLLMAALQYVDCPNYAALLLRRTYADLSLPGALMDRARSWLCGTDAHWQEQAKTWTFPSGASVTFGYVDNLQDKFRYQSSEFQFIGFDELTQFPEVDYRYLFSRLRRLADSDIPIRMRSASNPGNIGHDWVRQRFLIERNEDRMFLPARLEDNPYLAREEYEQSLMNLDPITRRQLLNGDWTARSAGNKFKREWFKIVDVAPVGLRCVRYWDMAATEKTGRNDPDYTAGALLGKSQDGNYYLKDMRHVRSSPQQNEALIRQTAQLDGFQTAIFMEQEPGASGKNLIDYYTRQVLPGYTFRGDKPTRHKEVRADPVSSQAEAGNLYLVRGPWLGEFLDEIEAFPLGSHDDQTDSLSGAFAQLNSQRMYGFGFPGQEQKWELEPA
jgi:predicted phage terminase large subunit-like protein